MIPDELPDKRLARLREDYGFDKPLPVAYAGWLAGWLADTVRLDLGTSFHCNEPVTQVIADRLPVSVYDGIIPAIFTYDRLNKLAVLIESGTIGALLADPDKAPTGNLPSLAAGGALPSLAGLGEPAPNAPGAFVLRCQGAGLLHPVPASRHDNAVAAPDVGEETRL